MADANRELLSAFDGHDVEAVRAALAAGADACLPVDGKEPIYWLLEEYTRSDRLKDCLQMLFKRGAVLHDPLLVPVLLDDAEGIRTAANENPKMPEHRVTLVSAFTSLVDVTLLHVAAEFGNQSAARALIEMGADVNAAAGIDEYGIGGHTPLFHTVNSNGNRSEPIMQMLLGAGADISVRLNGVYWGTGYEWETIFFDVTPISYAQLGLMPQLHRQENDIYSNIETMLRSAKRRVPVLRNVPNKYLQPKGHS